MISLVTIGALCAKHGVNIDRQPVVGSLLMSGAAPSVGAGTFIAPSVGSLVFTGTQARINADPLFSSVLYLTHFESVSGSDDVPIVGPNMTYNNGAARSNTEAKWGTYSGKFEGGTDLLGAGVMASAFGTGDFSVEFWFYSTTTDAQVLFGNASATTEVDHIEIGINDGGSNTGRLYYYVGESPAGIKISTINNVYTINTWNFLQLIRSSGTTRMYLNGSQVGSDYSDSFDFNSVTIWVGHGNYPAGGFAFQGYLDDFRITKAARTPGVPTEAFPDA